MGYRRSDNQIVLVQINTDLTEHSEAFSVDMDALADIFYEPKVDQAALVYRKDYGTYGEVLTLDDTGRKLMVGIKNIYQKKERADFLDFWRKRS